MRRIVTNLHIRKIMSIPNEKTDRIWAIWCPNEEARILLIGIIESTGVVVAEQRDIYHVIRKFDNSLVFSYDEFVKITSHSDFERKKFRTLSKWKYKGWREYFYEESNKRLVSILLPSRRVRSHKF